MSKYPRVVLFRYEKYAEIDSIFLKNKQQLDCEIAIIQKKDKLDLLYDVNFPVLVTYGPKKEEYQADITEVLGPRFIDRWLHMTEITDIKKFSKEVNVNFINMAINDRPKTRPIFSAFTTCYNSYDKIDRPFKTLLAQTLVDWEWVILDDSPDDKHFEFLRKKFKPYKKIRLFKRSENSGNIGNVKNEASSLCRGLYVLELDHDDEIVPDLFQEATDAFTKHPDVGFVYGETVNLYENGKNFFYGDFIALGYGGYYCQKYNDKWVNVYVAPQVNNISMSHLVSLPNHPRIWRRDVLFQIGNYSEYLPINDDQELLMRTFMNTKVLKLPKLCYIQYMNEGSNNFSLIRNHEINRIGPNYLVPQYYKKYDVHNVMKSRKAFDEGGSMIYHERIWLKESYVPKYYNLMYQPHYDTQYCIVGTEAFFFNIDTLKELHENPRNDFFFIDNHGNKEELQQLLDRYEFHRWSCYSIKNLTVKQMINYFKFIYASCENTVIIEEESNRFI